MARKKNKTKRPAAPLEKPPPAPPALTSSVQDEPSNQAKPTTTTTTTITTSEVPNEIKNVDKSREDLNQKQDAPKPQKDDDPIFFESGPQEKQANKRTNAKLRKNSDSADKIFSVRKYWNTLSIEKRRSFLEVSFHDLRAHYASAKDQLVADVLKEALSHAENNRTWKVWVCCRCSWKFKDCESHKQHVSEKHIGKLEPTLQQLLPEEPDSDSVDMILSGCWKPVDLCAAMEIIENQAEHQSLTTVDSSHGHSISQRWPLVDHDPERAKHLENIQCMFQLFLKHKCLSDENVKTVIHDAICDLEDLEPVLEYLDHGLDKTLACVCFLGEEQLLDLFLYLQDLSKLCQSGKDSEKTTSAEDTQGADALVSDSLEGIALSGDSNHLILKKFLLTEGTVSNRDENAALSEEGGPHGNSFLSWIYGSSSTDVELVSWTRMREERSRQGREIVQKLKEEFYHLRNLCIEKFRQECCSEAFSELSDLCDEELENSEQSVEYVIQSWISVLNKRLEELAERNDDPVLDSIERDAISAVLEKNWINNNKEDLRMLDNQHEIEKIVKGIEDEDPFSYLKINKFDVRIMQKLAAMQQLEHELEAMSAFDYREIMFLPVKKFLQRRLEDLAALNDAIEKSNSIAEELILAEEAESNANKGGDHSKQRQGKSKKKKKKQGDRRTKVGLDKEILSHQETEAQVTMAGETDVDQRESEFVATSESVDDLKQLEEDLEADERKLMERLEYQSRIENEAKQKRLAEKSEGSGLPKDSVGLHSGSVEKIAVPGPSNQGISKDGLSPNPTSDGHSQTLPEKEEHEASSCPSNQGTSEDGLSPSGRQVHSQNPTSDGHSQTLSEKENHEANPSQIDEERFEAGLTKVVQESLGLSNQGISEDGLSPSGRQSQSQNPTSDQHSQTSSEKEDHEASPSQIEDCFKEQTHPWDPQLEDNETKGQGQLSTEEHHEESTLAGETDVDQRESEFVATTESVDDLKQLEEDLEADERKLIERLEYQSRIENEAKQKCLAEKSVGSGLPKDSVGLHSGSVEKIAVPGPSNQGISKDVLSPNPTSDGHSQTLSEKENHEASSSQIAGCFKEQILSWGDYWLSQKNSSRELEILQDHDMEVNGLKKLYQSKHKHLCYMEAFYTLLYLCFDEIKKRINDVKHVAQSFKDLLRKRQEELIIESTENPVSTNTRFEQNAISHVVGGKEALNVTQSRQPASITSNLCDLEPDNKEDSSVLNCLNQADKSILLEIRRKGSQISLELSGLDARIKQNLAAIQQLKDELVAISANDYQVTMVRKYWNALSVKKKLSLLSSVSDDDLRAHYALGEDELEDNLLLEALSFRRSNRTCKFWACCLCGEKFADCKSHNQHVRVHIGNLLLKLQSVLPKEADSGWADMLLNGCWEPVDLHASMKILENRTRHKSLTTVESSDVGTRWPSVDDPERAKLLDGIHGMFQLFLNHKCLADTHVKKVIHYTMNELQGLVPGLQMIDHGLDQTPVCICFLDATQLQNVLDLLQELSNSCQLGKDSEKTTSEDDTQSIDTLASDVLEGINLKDDSSLLISNEYFLLTARNNKAENAGMGDCMKDSVLSEGGLGGDAFLSWLFATSDDLEAVSWNLLREEKSRRGMEILPELEKEFNHLQKLCQEKCEHLCYMEAFQTLIDLCYEEFKKRHHSVEYVAQSFEALLRKWREELVENKDNAVFINSSFEENAISLVLKGKQALNVTDQCGQPGLTSHLCDLESSNKDEYSRMMDNLDQADKSILSGIRTHGSKFSLELCRLDARIMQNLDSMQQLERELGAMSSFDYREILFCLIRPLWRALLEDLANKDGKEKSDAAREL